MHTTRATATVGRRAGTGTGGGGMSQVLRVAIGAVVLLAIAVLSGSMSGLFQRGSAAAGPGTPTGRRGHALTSAKGSSVQAHRRETPPRVRPTMRPLPEDIKAETFARTRTKYECFQLNPTTTADTLGVNMGTSFYCVVENFCVTADQWTLFDDSRAGQRFDFPRQPLMQHPFTTFRMETDNAEFRSAALNNRLFFDDEDNDDHSKLSVLIKNSYCCGHIRHFMEPIPTLQHALRDLEKNATRRAMVGIKGDRVVVARGGITFPSVEAGDLSRWNEFMLHAAVGGPKRPDFTFPDGLLHMRDTDTRCFKKALVPGAVYHLFQSQEMAHGFRDAIWARLAHAKKHEAAKPTPNPILTANLGGPDGLEFVHDPKKRVILYAQRDAKRSITDNVNMEKILAQTASLVNATVKTIKFGDHPFAVQAAHAQEADVMIGLHGADLTNLVFQRKGAVVIEMNPLFFFESGYREMAAQLEVHYNAWTCTAPTCAFGGVRARWGQVIGNMADLKYNETTRVLTAPNFEPWVWPYKGYVAGCMQCDKSSCCTPLANAFYSALRDDNVRVGEHAAEIAEVLIEGFQSLGWIPTDVSAKELAERTVRS